MEEAEGAVAVVVEQLRDSRIPIHSVDWAVDWLGHRAAVEEWGLWAVRGSRNPPMGSQGAGPDREAQREAAEPLRTSGTGVRAERAVGQARNSRRGDREAEAGLPDSPP